MTDKSNLWKSTDTFTNPCTGTEHCFCLFGTIQLFRGMRSGDSWQVLWYNSNLIQQENRQNSHLAFWRRRVSFFCFHPLSSLATYALSLGRFWTFSHHITFKITSTIKFRICDYKQVPWFITEPSQLMSYSKSLILLMINLYLSNLQFYLVHLILCIL